VARSANDVWRIYPSATERRLLLVEACIIKARHTQLYPRMMTLSSKGNTDDIRGIAFSDRSKQDVRGSRHIVRSADGEGSLEEGDVIISATATFAQLKTRRPPCLCAKNRRVGLPKQDASDIEHGMIKLHVGL
jgi:hypothetical protein